jgi:hypothetical protein
MERFTSSDLSTSVPIGKAISFDVSHMALDVPEAVLPLITIALNRAGMQKLAMCLEFR